MSIIDILYIEGMSTEVPEDQDPGFYEYLEEGEQDISMVVQPSEISVDTNISQSLWDAQTGVIDAQSDYLNKVKDVFNAKFINLPKVSDLRNNLIQEFLEEAIGELVERLTSFPFSGLITELVIGNIGDFITYLQTVLTNYASICDAMKEENEALKSLEMNLQNYDLRNQVLRRHDETIDNLLLQVSHAEEGIRTREEKLPKGWQKWINDIRDSIDDLDSWMTTATDGNPNNNLPVPTIPKIPKTTDIQTIALYYILKYGLRMVGEFFNKWLDGRGGKEDLVQAVKDLQFNGQEIDLGNVKILLSSKVVDVH